MLVKLSFDPRWAYQMKTKFSYSLAVIQDYHPLKQASLHIDDIAGVATRYEFMNSGGILIRHRLISDIRCQKKQDCM